jgi:hypothetical protein
MIPARTLQRQARSLRSQPGASLPSLAIFHKIKQTREPHDNQAPAQGAHLTYPEAFFGCMSAPARADRVNNLGRKQGAGCPGGKRGHVEVGQT